MDRCDVNVTEREIFVERHDKELRIGSLDSLYDAIGGKRYTVEFNHQQAMMAWHNRFDRELTIDVRENVASMDIPLKLAERLAELDDGAGQNERIELLADVLEAAWSQQGIDGGPEP
ncbi:hypothetical protein SAMN04487948_11158 [Halogranum amylolyticum]|uniref:Uncharacterized protein n=1 Tax=Halogranum amylolyticum TaxID=660520 RepID=A0A1H8UI78_9EURY|nr:hypothetical protein [Halogranum amylolyticum]SEP02942.1 hypothetical protein SAMN04487948_11158 [Halogranum amylolyticum]